ncbi:GNAT family N-acetyltransferase [Stygiolobus caldivivus]|uniref:GNAT family N-acetyltransferase n=1 Tax=Stygiolobus caldivivus TaxID=2824673 RepID=UPI001C8492BE|nr:GNAT family N-acetyltransferase [Stygiolobus caldivivus]
MELQVNYRKAEEKDWKKVLELYNCLSAEDLYLRFFSYHKLSEEEAKKIVSGGDHYTIIVELGDKIIGEGTIYTDGEFALVVHPDYRRLGIGTEIVKRLIEVAKEKKFCGVKFYTLPDNYPMIRIGKKLGFTITEDSDEVFGYLKLNCN